MPELLVQSFVDLFQWQTFLILCFGVILGMIIGALPGLNIVMGVSLFTPLAVMFAPRDGLCLLLGIYNAALFGGAISAILINTPGTPAAIATTFDGYPMTLKGKAGLALGLSAWGSLWGGILSLIAFLLLAAPMSALALKFGPAEYFALCLLGLTLIITLSGENFVKGLLMGIVGLLLATIGRDPIYGIDRFSLGITPLADGIPFVAAIIGLFCLSEVFLGLRNEIHAELRSVTIGKIFPSFKDITHTAPAMLISSIIGTIVGIIPAVGADVASLASYEAARSISKNKSEFGKGSHEGLIAAETANNAVVGGALTTMLTLGIPGDAVTAILIGTLLMWGLQPGPALFQQEPRLIYDFATISFLATVLSFAASLFRAKKVAGIILNLKPHVLYSLIILFCFAGTYSISNSFFDVGVMIVCGVLGYCFKIKNYPLGPLVIGLILGSLMESNFKRALLLSDGSLLIFLKNPLAALLLVITAASLIVQARLRLKRT